MSSSTIGLIVYGKDETEAKEKAIELLQGMCKDDGNAPYCEFQLGNIYSEYQEEMQKEIKEFWGTYSNRIRYALSEIRGCIAKYSNTELLEEVTHVFPSTPSDLSLFRHYCYVVGRYKGDPVCLYDNDGEGIRNQRHIQDALSKWVCLGEHSKKYKEKIVFLVEATVWY